MKARRRKTRWLLVAALFGFLAVAGFALTHHHRGNIEAARYPLGPPQRPTLPRAPTPLLASLAGESTERVPSERVLEQAPTVARPQSSPADEPTQDIQPHGAEVSRPSLPVSRNFAPGAAAPVPLPRHGAGGFVYESSGPLGCELAAGCGAGSANINASSNQPNTPSNRADPPGGAGLSRGSGAADGSAPPAGSGPAPGATDPFASAPELDPTTLAGALTLLLGALLIVRSRRARAPR